MGLSRPKSSREPLLAPIVVVQNNKKQEPKVVTMAETSAPAVPPESPRTSARMLPNITRERIDICKVALLCWWQSLVIFNRAGQAGPPFYNHRLTGLSVLTDYCFNFIDGAVRYL